MLSSTWTQSKGDEHALQPPETWPKNTALSCPPVSKIYPRGFFVIQQSGSPNPFAAGSSPHFPASSTVLTVSAQPQQLHLSQTPNLLQTSWDLHMARRLKKYQGQETTKPFAPALNEHNKSGTSTASHTSLCFFPQIIFGIN